MDNQSQILIASLIINILMIIERFLKRIKKSTCCGNTLEMDNKEQEMTEIKLNVSDIKKNDINEKN